MNGEIKQPELVVTVQRTNRTSRCNGLITPNDNNVTNHYGNALTGFTAPNIYGSLSHTWHLKQEALIALIAANTELRQEKKCVLLVDAWRSWEYQMKSHYRKPGWVVHPKYSNHPRGLAIDARMFDAGVGVFDQKNEKTWGDQDYLAEVLESYGFFRTVMPKEPWHFDFKGEPKEQDWDGF